MVRHGTTEYGLGSQTGRQWAKKWNFWPKVQSSPLERGVQQRKDLLI